MSYDPHCPKCNQPEEVDYVCVHCDHVYTHEELDKQQDEYDKSQKVSWYNRPAGIIACLFFSLYMTCVICVWLTGQSEHGDHRTLVQVFVDSFEFIKRLAKTIY